MPKDKTKFSWGRTCCLTCRFGDPLKETFNHFLRCKKHAPFYNEKANFSAWPAVPWDEWCGDFQTILPDEEEMEERLRIYELSP